MYFSGHLHYYERTKMICDNGSFSAEKNGIFEKSDKVRFLVGSPSQSQSPSASPPFKAGSMHKIRYKGFSPVFEGLKVRDVWAKAHGLRRRTTPV